MRAGQAPIRLVPLVSSGRRDPNWPRNTGSLFDPPLRTAEKPGMVLR